MGEQIRFERCFNLFGVVKDLLLMGLILLNWTEWYAYSILTLGAKKLKIWSTMQSNPYIIIVWNKQVNSTKNKFNE